MRRAISGYLGLQYILQLYSLDLPRVGHDQHLVKMRCGDIVGISHDFKTFINSPRFGKVADILNVNGCCFVLLDVYTRADFDDPFYFFDHAPVSKMIAPLKTLSSPVIYHMKKIASSFRIVVLSMPY